MIPLKFIRENIDLVKKNSKSKNVDVDIDNIILLDKERRNIIVEVEGFKAERNNINQNISKLKKEKKDCTDVINDMKIISNKIKNLDSSLNEKNTVLNEKLLYIPNLIHVSVPKGKSENDNVVIKEWGEKPEFDYKTKGHKELCESLNLVDFKRASKISGSGFPLYTNSGAKLERSLINFMLDVHVNENDYIEIFPPFLVNPQSPKTTGNLPKFKEDMYFIENDDLYCIPTAEVPITNIHGDEVISLSDIPKKYVAYSACFRREAGSYGKDTKGLLRLHQFNKVELVKFVHPSSSYDELELLLHDAEKILQKLNLHYRVISLCSGDLSFSASKCYDIEVWSPFEEKYLEVSSCSNFENFQAIRGNIKFQNKDKQDFVHTLNGSGLATPRLMVSILETYQQEDGSITIPDPLIPYFILKQIKGK